MSGFRKLPGKTRFLLNVFIEFKKSVTGGEAAMNEKMYINRKEFEVVVI